MSTTINTEYKVTVKTIMVPGMAGELVITSIDQTIKKIQYRLNNNEDGFTIKSKGRELGNFILLMKEYIITEEL